MEPASSSQNSPGCWPALGWLELTEAEGGLAPALVRLEGGELDAVLVVGEDVDETNSVNLYVRSLGFLEKLDDLRWALSEVISDRRLRRAGYDPEGIKPLLAQVEIVPVLVGGEKGLLTAIAVPLGLGVLLMMGALFSSSMLLQSVIKEKSNRVMELILSSISARELMAGKFRGMASSGWCRHPPGEGRPTSWPNATSASPRGTYPGARGRPSSSISSWDIS